MLKTKMTEFFDIEYPIVQGGLMYIARAELVGAVSEAGAIGFLTALTQPTPEDLRAEIAKTREITDKPFGVNLTILPSLSAPDYPGYIKVCVEEGIKFIETAGRNPEPLLGPIKAAGRGTRSPYHAHRRARVRIGVWVWRVIGGRSPPASLGQPLTRAKPS